jgi:hypothetical protein
MTVDRPQLDDGRDWRSRLVGKIRSGIKAGDIPLGRAK